MTNRLTNGGGKPQAENAGIKGFARFNVRDSFSIPATDSSAGGSTPDSGSQTSQRVSKKQLLEMDSRLGERDRELLGVVQQYRYLMTGQIQRLVFTEAANSSAGLRATNRNLKKLYEFGLINRLSRRIGGVRAGSSSLMRCRSRRRRPRRGH